MKFVLEIEGSIEFTDEAIPEKTFVIAYESPSKTYLIVDLNDVSELLELARRLDASTVLPVREIKKLSKVVYDSGYREVIDQ